MVAQWQHHRLLFWGDLSIGAGCFALYQLRRRWPVFVAATTAAAGAVSALSFGPGVMAFISVSTRRRWREVLPIAAISLVAGVVYQSVQPTTQQSPWYLDILFNVLVAGASIAIGMYIGARRELIATLQDRAERAEREQSMRVSQARLNERARIAREMHDALAHRISLVAMHAGALAYRQDLSPAEMSKAAEVIQTNAHNALSDLREVLGLLRQTDGVVLRPQPTIDDIPELISEAERSGMRIRLVSESDDLSSVPETIGRSAYRMVQESLTNARKHAPYAAVDVTVSGRRGDRLLLTVRNRLWVGAGRTELPGAGMGLVGLAERAVLSGGQLEHGLTDDGDFEVRAWLPWPA